jgi:DNA (cytosine-5)-methyltransferase 1
MRPQLVLSLFPGIDLFGRAFEEEGFHVVRGPDVIFGGDIRRFHVPPGRFDGVIGGPPCQLFSQLRHLNPDAGKRFGNLIPEFERVVSEARPEWFLMENVPAAPEPTIAGYRLHSQIVNNRWFGADQERTRRFCFGTHDGKKIWPDTVVFESRRYSQAVTGQTRAVPVKIGGSGRVKRTYTAEGKRHGPDNGPREKVGRMLELQGFPRTLLDDCPMTEAGKRMAVGNGVPMAMGRALARAIIETLRLDVCL